MIVITGATGFLGGRLVRFYQQQGEEVLALGRNHEKLKALEGPGVTTLSRSLEVLRPEDIPDSAKMVIHTAALSSPFGPYQEFYRHNVEATQSLVHALRRHQARLVHISTPAVYASYQDQENVLEDHPLPRPVNTYAATKLLAEKALRDIEDRTIILRPRGIYGRGDTALLPRMLAAARSGPIPLLRGGRAATDITHVDDVVKAIECARQAPDSAWGRVYNISGPYGVRVSKIIERAAARAGQEVQFKDVPWPVAYRVAQMMELVGKVRGKEPRVTPYGLLLLAFTQTLNCDLAARYLKWRPGISFEMGLDEVFGEEV